MIKKLLYHQRKILLNLMLQPEKSKSLLTVNLHQVDIESNMLLIMNFKTEYWQNLFINVFRPLKCSNLNL